MRRTKLSFDELNSLSRSEYEDYFGEMGIDDDAKEDRVLIAMALEERILSILAMIETRKERGMPYFADSLSLFEQAYIAVALSRMGMTEDDARRMAETFATNVALSTFRHEDTAYYTSADRAVNIAKTESNGINNYGDLLDAKNSGKTKKKWNAIIDFVTREWHRDEALHGEEIPIDEPFEIIGEMLMCPGDASMGASADNIANCRCWLTFS